VIGMFRWTSGGERENLVSVCKFLKQTKRAAAGGRARKRDRRFLHALGLAHEWSLA
jgi:hypothetical protein